MVSDLGRPWLPNSKFHLCSITGLLHSWTSATHRFPTDPGSLSLWASAWLSKLVVSRARMQIPAGASTSRTFGGRLQKEQT